MSTLLNFLKQSLQAFYEGMMGIVSVVVDTFCDFCPPWKWRQLPPPKAKPKFFLKPEEVAAYFRQVFAQSSLPNSQDPTEEEKDLLASDLDSLLDETLDETLEKEKDLLASDLDSLLDETLDETLERTHEEALNQAYEAYFDQYLETADPYTQYFENAAPVEAPPALIMDLDSIVLPEGFPPREIDPDDYADDDPAPVEAPPGKLPSAMESLVELLPRYSLILLALGVLGYGVVTLAPTMLASNLLGLGVAVAVQGCGYHPALAVLLSYLTRSLLLEVLSRWQRP